MTEILEDIADELDGISVHAMRLARAIRSQAQGAASPADAGPQLLHALSRYGEWARPYAVEIAAGKVPPIDIAAQLATFARAQAEALGDWMDSHGQAPKTTMTEVSERDLDFLLAEEVECNPSFAAWLLDLTDGEGSIVSIARSVATAYGETDLLIVHEDPEGSRRAIMIENKVAAAFQEFQAERYRRRGEAGVAEGEWASFCTVLIAPRKYLSDVAEGDFDKLLAYEDIDAFLATMPSNPRTAFKRRIIAQALGKSKTPWVKKVDADLTQFFSELREFAIARYPSLPYPPDRQPRAPTSTWLMVTVGKYPRSRLTLELKPEGGHVDLHFSALPADKLRTILCDRLPQGATTVQFGRHGTSKVSSAIRFVLTPLDVRAPFAGQETLAEAYAEKSDVLLRFHKDNDSLFTAGLS